jgi:hypothetical protein
MSPFRLGAHRRTLGGSYPAALRILCLLTLRFLAYLLHQEIVRVVPRTDITSTSRMTGSPSRGSGVLLFETEELASALEGG